ncbi:MAG TPA: magnesium transporter [Aggregatilinea sp.]|uniref:magnesium transporter n=1 Tax=Aggregatilinea sp. TaxID=2806333 RepID=UPI002CBAA5A6|nr:magnesium transporter [Aggregatilinea sp.]HML21751.1 magnesium transporter [Aggregatilinea sp.]
METPILDDILARVRDALERDDIANAVDVLEGLRPPDQAELFAELEDDHQLALLPELNPTDSADILEKLDEAEAAELASALPTETLAHIIDEMEPDEAADLLGDIDPDQARDVLAVLDDSDEIHPLMLHADDSAGGLMTSDFLALRRRMNAGEALQAIRNWQPETESIYHLFVVDAQNVLAGVVSLRQLILAAPATPLIEIMDSDVISVTVGTDQEECARVMSRYDLVALPVVDAQRKLVGVVTIDDVVDVLVDEATEDIQRMGGAQPLNRSYLESSVYRVMRSRITWLLMLFVTESLTGTVLRHFENELSEVVALTFFVPLLIGTGGNAGSQTTSTIIRALAVGELKWSDALHALWHELRVGILLGIGMAIIAYLRALTWGSSSDLALTISLAIFTIVVWANGLGSVLPMLATRLHIDPTVVSGPVMSTLVDATGLFIYFTTARIIMGL